MAVALILDSSEQMERRVRRHPGARRHGVLEAVSPPHARLTIWTCGGKVSHAVDFGTEPEAGESTLQMVAVGGPIFALDTLIDASRISRRPGKARVGRSRHRQAGSKSTRP